MRKYLIILMGVLFLFACNNDNVKEELKTSNDNALLAQKVNVDVRIGFENKDNPDWVKGFDNKVFVETVFEDIFSGKFKELYMRKGEKVTEEYVRERMGERTDTIINYADNPINNDTVFNKIETDFSEIKEIYFNEEWDFDKNNFIFNKKICTWLPIRVFHRPDDTEKKDTRYKLIFEIRENDKSNFSKQIAKDYISIFKYYETSYYANRTGLDKKEFFKFLLQSIETGKIKTFDPIYLVDKSKREFTVDQLKNYAGISLDSEEFANEVDKMIFVEDWYFDENTFNISKKVKGLGFIADRRNENREWEEKILFFIFFE